MASSHDAARAYLRTLVDRGFGQPDGLSPAESVEPVAAAAANLEAPV